MYRKSDEYTELMLRVIEQHVDLHWIRDNVSICCLASIKERKSKGGLVYGECRKVSEYYKPFCPYDFLITIYEANCSGLSDQQMEVLMYHELLHVDMSEKDGEPVYKVRPHDVEDFGKILHDYGIDWAEKP
ncbi:MAG: putative metallopeptidase [Eubacteriales bacterium]|nr:putative metallopeptidase [Eubacteriales bacterium]